MISSFHTIFFLDSHYIPTMSPWFRLDIPRILLCLHHGWDDVPIPWCQRRCQRSSRAPKMPLRSDGRLGYGFASWLYPKPHMVLLNGEVMEKEQVLIIFRNALFSDKTIYLTKPYSLQLNMGKARIYSILSSNLEVLCLTGRGKPIHIVSKNNVPIKYIYNIIQYTYPL